MKISKQKIRKLKKAIEKTFGPGDYLNFKLLPKKEIKTFLLVSKKWELALRDKKSGNFCKKNAPEKNGALSKIKK